MSTPVAAAIRSLLAQHAGLRVPADTLGRDDDLYQAGMSSHASVTVMLALEDHFDLEFPDRMLTREVFASIAAIEAAITELTGEASPA